MLKIIITVKANVHICKYDVIECQIATSYIYSIKHIELCGEDGYTIIIKIIIETTANYTHPNVKNLHSARSYHTHGTRVMHSVTNLILD